MHITIDGFRSLQNFTIDLTPGLNILVGPNGSGKTNFLQSLRFLRDLINRGPNEAVSNAGGVFRVFSQEALKKTPAKIRIKFEGIIDLSLFSFISEREGFVGYCYEIDIYYRKKNSALYISDEKVWLTSILDTVPADLSSGHAYVGSISVQRKPKNWNELQRPTISNGLRRCPQSINPLAIMRRSETRVRKNYIESILQWDIKNSFISFGFRTPILRLIERTILGTEPVNIVPERCKSPDDISTPPAVEADGSGLSSTLNAIYLRSRPDWRGDEDEDATMSGMFRYPKDAYESVLSWTTMIFPALRQIEGRTSLFDGTVTAWVGIADSRGNVVRMSLAALSDGTVKWLALVCYIIMDRLSMAIEEPENFLHPAMQENLISILRETYEGRRDRYVLISTHSETILDICSPRELILFSFDDTRTSCRRVESPEEVEIQINESGFRLSRAVIDNVL